MSTLILRPNADGSTLEWTCSSGSDHYALIDEATPDDADYVYGGAFGAGKKDYYTYPNHSTETGVISNITLYGRFKTDNPYPVEAPQWSMSWGVVISSTEYKYQNTVTNAYANYSAVLSTNPNTGVAWTWDDIDNLTTVICTTWGTSEVNPTVWCSQLYIEVTYTIPPIIDSFTADPSSIDYGDTSTLTWATTHATSCSINQGIGSVDVDGNTGVSPTETKTYTLTATNVSGNATADVTVTILPPTINTFTADPEAIQTSFTSTLSWTITGAVSASIDQGIGAVPTTGTRKVLPTETTTYVLTATNSSGTDTDSVIVTVIPIIFTTETEREKQAEPDQGRMPQFSSSRDYLAFSSEITDHYVKSLGYSYPSADFKQPYKHDGYHSMMYLFEPESRELSGYIKNETGGNIPNKNDKYFDFSPQLASLDNFNYYAQENYRLMGKIKRTASKSFAGSTESISCDLGTNIVSGRSAILSVVSPRYESNKYSWSGAVKTGSGDWGSFSSYTGLSITYFTPILTTNYRDVVITLKTGGKEIATIELRVYFLS